MNAAEMTTTEMATTFRRAAEVIRDGGLIQGNFVDGTAHCVIGALMTARDELPYDAPQALPEIHLLAVMVGSQSCVGLISWNDAPGRTAGDVIALLEHAAEKVEAEL